MENERDRKKQPSEKPPQEIRPCSSAEEHKVETITHTHTHRRGGGRGRERERASERASASAHDQYFQEAWDILKDLRTHWEEGGSEINSKGISQII